MNLFRALICGGLILCGGSSFAQKNLMSADSLCKIYGVVLDQTSGLPLEGCIVRLEGTKRSAISDANGFFAFPVFEKGPQRLVAASIGYRSDTLSVELRPGHRTTQNFSLRPANDTVGGAEIGSSSLAEKPKRKLFRRRDS